MRRRRLIAATAGLGVGTLAGCLDRLTDGTGTALDGNESGDAATTDGNEAGVRVLGAAASPEVVGLDDDSIRVVGDRDEQFLVVTVGTTTDAGPAIDEFALDTGAETYRPADDLGRSPSLWEHGAPYGGDRNSGRVGFVLPNPVGGDRVTLTWPDGERALDEATVSELARPPTDFAVREFAAPATVENPGTVSLSLTLENVGERAGTFVGALNRVGPEIAYAPEATIRLDLEAAEAAVWEHEYAVSTTRADAEVRFRLHWRDGSETREVAVETE